MLGFGNHLLGSLDGLLVASQSVEAGVFGLCSLAGKEALGFVPLLLEVLLKSCQ